MFFLVKVPWLCESNARNVSQISERAIYYSFQVLGIVRCCGYVACVVTPFDQVFCLRLVAVVEVYRCGIFLLLNVFQGCALVHPYRM